MNIAIVIGVSKYSDIKNNLPGCKNDAKAIYDLLVRTDKFAPILYINEDETSTKTKELIINFISEHKKNPIDEFFFYYSGHGEFSSDEFFYILSDFTNKKKKQTSLQNSEIDDLIRTLTPNLVIKVIDACQSGTAYIKESDVINKYFTETKNVFKKCYFLNSSLNSQSSYQSPSISAFTSSFINAVKEHTSTEIRYKDIIDFISDEFEGNQEQTPFFVAQAEYTEKFCVLSKAIKEYFAAFNPESIILAGSKSKVSTLAELVKQDASEYVDKAGAIKAVELVRNEYSSFKLDSDIEELFDVKINFGEDYHSVPKKSVIGIWLKENENTSFAYPTYEKVLTTKGTLSQFAGLDTFFNRPEDYKLVINGFEQKIEVPFKTISIDINSKHPNLSSYNYTVVFLLSKNSIRLFYFITNYFEDD